MPSSPIEISSSPSASSTFSDAVSSYHRAQLLLSSSNITTTDAFPGYLRQEEERQFAHDIEQLPDIDEVYDDAQTPRAIDVIDPLWDDELQASIINERTPLNKKISWQRETPSYEQRRLVRQVSRASTDSKAATYYLEFGKSTYQQTLFNAIAILLGIGMLSEPLAFAYSGWIYGSILIILYGYMTCYTAKILAHIIADDPSLRTYADIGFKAFGRKSTVLTGFLFCLELFSVGVVLITLSADSLHLIIPAFTPNQYKIMSLVVLLPTVFMPLSILSYASVLGIVSSVLIVVCIAIDGLVKREGPGSFWEPEATSLIVNNIRTLGVAFGLFMAGFGGHAVMPSLARDMQNPREFDGMINWAFTAATAVYGIIGAAGYIMFGDRVSEEISKNILETSGYPPFLNKLTVWMLVIAPLSKFALNCRPLSLTIEIWLGIDNPGSQPATPSRPPSPASKSAAALATSPQTTTRPILLVFERICLTLLVVAVSIIIPEFSTMMAFLGSFSAFVLCVIGPLCAKIAIEGKCSWFDGILLGLAVIFTIWGTAAAFSESG